MLIFHFTVYIIQPCHFFPFCRLVIIRICLQNSYFIFLHMCCLWNISYFKLLSFFIHPINLIFDWGSVNGLPECYSAIFSRILVCAILAFYFVALMFFKSRFPACTLGYQPASHFCCVNWAVVGFLPLIDLPFSPCFSPYILNQSLHFPRFFHWCLTGGYFSFVKI